MQKYNFKLNRRNTFVGFILICAVHMSIIGTTVMAKNGTQDQSIDAASLVQEPLESEIESVILETSDEESELVSSQAEESSNDIALSDSEVIDDVTYYDIPLSIELQKFTMEVAEFYGLNADTMFKMMYVESRFNPDAQNSICKGILQLHKSYYKSYAVNNDKYDQVIADSGIDVFDVKTNIVISARMQVYWRNQCEQRGYNSESDYLNCYNLGFTYFKNKSQSYSRHVLSVELELLEQF